MERTFLVCYIAGGWKWRSEKEIPRTTKIILSGEEKAIEAIFVRKIKDHTSCAYPIVLSWSLIEE